ncbi:protein trichome birefringence-like 42 isoform X2 [Phalaenopsis equestris]|uniref:protein trichome birefringence-like 42 isoform X2 n=1 Tax=Phalaenopsis equestris TaxID=78828 RepID=UPI0009E2EFC0|nr:protein trichome birefringence-like 42 isoform X2 [Phalaenopsis equestris]
MESSSKPPLNLKWLFCLLCGFIGIFFLSSYLSKNYTPSSTSVESLQALSFYNLNLSPNSNHSAEAPCPAAYSIIAPTSPPPALAPVIAPSPQPNAAPEALLQKQTCNLLEGRWVYDPKEYPLYTERQCPFLSQQVNCQKNGRPDSDYMHWKWEPQGCDIPRFNGIEMLLWLRGKRMVIVGDSLNRNQWESLACLLYSSVHPSRTVIKLRDSHKLFRAIDYDCSVEFYWSPFLVRVDENKEGDKILKLDKMPEESRLWRSAAVLVFNTGHWWTHSGRMRSWKYYEWRGELVGEMERDSAYGIAMRTWADWVDRHVNPNKTAVFFRSISPEHKREEVEADDDKIHSLWDDFSITAEAHRGGGRLDLRRCNERKS